MDTDWGAMLLAYLHDPPDKALLIRGHVPRARDNAKIAVGDHVSKSVLEDAVSSADPQASIIERFPMPTAGDQGQQAVGPKNGQLRIAHPLSAVARDLPVPSLNEQLTENERVQVQTVIADLPGEGQEQMRNRLLAVWRLWPDALAMNVHECLALLPADTRTPDHTIWNHLDTTTAYKAALSGDGGPALLSFALGPVQRFIEAARSVRDLWSGSMILSWLAFRAMLPIIEQLGPTALIYPALRGNPMLDLWLRDPQRVGGRIPLPDVELRRTPALPHRFLALVPWGRDGASATELAALCQKAAADAWLEMAKAVRQRIQKAMEPHCHNWDKRWDSQIGSYFSFSAAVLPLAGSGDEIDRRLARLLTGSDSFRKAFPNAEAVREMARAIPEGERPGYDQDHAGRWQYHVELVQRSLAAQRSIRHVPPNSPVGNNSERWPQKCTLLGSFEQMGPDDLADSESFWDTAADPMHGLNVDGVRIRKGEALCAVAMVKRFAGPAILAAELNAETPHLRFPDTWTVAAAEWLKRASIDWKADWCDTEGKRVPWNGHWLHWSAPDEDLEEADACPPELWERIQDARKPDKCGKPPVYYAILKLDGDDLGGWLRGEKSPKVLEVMHPTLVAYYERFGEQAKAGLEATRPVGPALHAAISTALSNFALHVVPDVVGKHHGTVIYSGGDDTLILLPVSTALACATELRQAYMSDWYAAGKRKYLMMGSRATLSGGLVAVHAKDDLRLALQDARRAEKLAKEAGKDALAITIRRRSGEHTSAVCRWDFVSTVDHWAQQFRSGASDRWAYHLYMERSSLAALPVEAMQAEIRRQITRAEEPTPQLLPPACIAAAFESFRSRFHTAGEALESFLTLCHSASFLARGRDR